MGRDLFAYLAQLLSGREIFEGMSGEAPGAREERLHVVRAHRSAASRQSLDTSLGNETEGAAAAAEKRRDSSTRRERPCAIICFATKKKQQNEKNRRQRVATRKLSRSRLYPSEKPVVDFYVAICDRRD